MFKAMIFYKKTALITGAASGIGYSCSRALAAAGARVFCFDRNQPQEKVAGVTYLRGDVTSGASIRAALKRIDGQVDIVFNNAGIMKRGNIMDASEADFDRLFAVHVKGSWLMFKHCRPRLSADAILVQMSSRHALYFPSDPGLYALVKRAALDLAELMAQTYPQYRVKILCPGPVDTPLSRTECGAEAWQKKAQLVCTPDFLAQKILELLTSGKSKLIFDQESCDYYFE